MDPVLVVIDVQPKELGIPTDAYIAVEEIRDDGTATTKTFAHVASVIEAEEAEEIGVEHLLRDIKDNAVSGLSTSVSRQQQALKGLEFHLGEIERYLGRVEKGELAVNHAVVYQLQDMFNCLPNVGEEMMKAVAVNTNDNLLMVYLSSLMRCIVSLHNLIDNKLENNTVTAAESK